MIAISDTKTTVIFETLRAARRGRKIKQGALAKRIGVTQGYLSYLEKGQREPVIGVVERWADELGFTLSLTTKPNLYV